MRHSFDPAPSAVNLYLFDRKITLKKIVAGVFVDSNVKLVAVEFSCVTLWSC